MNAPNEVPCSNDIPTAVPAPSLNASAGPRVPLDAVALAEIFASLAHAMRSPVGVVSGAITELRSELAHVSTDEQRLLASLADRGLLRLRHLADVLSLASSLGSPSFELRIQPVDVKEIIHAAVGATRALEPRREVEIVLDLPPAGCPAVADADRLSRAFTEVIINAVRFAVRKVRVRLEAGEGEVRVAIEDDGAGVAEEMRDTLYCRVAARRSSSGLGMGLSIAYDVVAAHGGRLALEASTLPPGRPGTTGARFSISMPRINA